MAATPTTAATAPIPAFAPVERPLFAVLEVEGEGFKVGEEVDEVVDCVDVVFVVMETGPRTA
jgi:hypothetical protein